MGVVVYSLVHTKPQETQHFPGWKAEECCHEVSRTSAAKLRALFTEENVDTNSQKYLYSFPLASEICSFSILRMKKKKRRTMSQD